MELWREVMSGGGYELGGEGLWRKLPYSWMTPEGSHVCRKNGPFINRPWRGRTLSPMEFIQSACPGYWPWQEVMSLRGGETRRREDAKIFSTLMSALDLSSLTGSLVGQVFLAAGGGPDSRWRSVLGTPFTPEKENHFNGFSLDDLVWISNSPPFS